MPTPVPQASGWPSSGANLGTGIVTESSPTLADLDGNGTAEAIFVGTSDGYLVRVNGSNGSIAWKKRLADYGLNQSGCATGIIRSSPAIGTLRQPGGSAVKAVVVGVGDYPFTSSTGGVLALRASDGALLWFHAASTYGGWTHCSNGVVASPTVTDVDKDGRDEVMFGSFDHWFYILRDDGTNYPNWPQIFMDTHWSSPAVGDIDGDGQNEIIVASDEGKVPAGCPYPLEWPQDYCGGTVYAMRPDGTWLSGFPYFTWQAIQSQPALADLNADGHLDIIFGSGTYYAADQSFYRDTFKVFAIDYRGQNLTGWPVDIDGVANSEPAIGDLNGDGSLDVVMGTSNYYCNQTTCGGLRLGHNIGYVYALRNNGQTLWPPRQMRTSYDNQYGPIQSPMIADYDNDGQMEIIYSVQWEVQIINGATGNYEVGGWNTLSPNNKVMYGNWTIQSAPAIGDVNGDGKQDIVAAGARSGGAIGGVYAWTPSNATGSPSHPWPMFRRNASHTGRLTMPARPAMAGGPPSTLMQLHQPGGGPYTYVFTVLNSGGTDMSFSVTDTHSAVTAKPTSATTIGAGQSKTMTVTINLSGYNTPGTYNLGTITMLATDNGGAHASGSPRVINVSALVANTIYDLYLPLQRK